MAKRPCLFVGGTGDGRFIDIADHAMDHCLAVYVPTETVGYDEPGPVGHLREEHYTRRFWQADGKRFTMFALRSMSMIEVTEALFAGYRKPK